ncbi:AEC family transporter [Actinoplanes sp. NEAU-A12]|uniref:AEC family transporter n=1 Tax=Actinoplanes sandaracinus TaxID=3045177 RepID=A0ABT6WGW5_9ACTN|nr:AEC family transporter [Actinoplanes sandaracinus]MDI6098945.1 AEC family transporter [Actinoplanes sandaracinus]
MIDALTGFALLAAIVLSGWALRRWGKLPGDTEAVLGRVTYLALAPCLLFEGTADAELRRLAGGPLLVSAMAAVVCFAVFAVLFVRRDRGTRILGALAGGYTNANYIGIPIATHILGDASLVVPIMLLQLLILTPMALTLLDATTSGAVSWRSAVLAPAGNPLIIAVAAGALVNITGVRLPQVLAAPVTTIGQAAVPVVLIAFGMSLSGRRVLAPGPDRLPAAVAVLLKTAGMPLVAFLLAWALGLPRDTTYTVTILAALPAAQNLYLYAQRAGTGLVLIRDAIFLSTLCCVPAMLTITALLGG